MPGLKGPPGASSNRIVRPSVCPFCLFVRLSVISFRLQTKCNIQSLGDDTVTKLGLLVLLWVPHTSLTSHAPGVGRGQNIGLEDFFCHILTLLPRGASVFHKHMSSFMCFGVFFFGGGGLFHCWRYPHARYRSKKLLIIFRNFKGCRWRGCPFPILSVSLVCN